MRLPHQEPLLFAREVIEKRDNEAIVLCEFELLPTLPMFIEAAAQSCAAFAPRKSDDIPTGFLVSCRDVKRLAPPAGTRFRIKIFLKVDMGKVKNFFFEASNLPANRVCASGNITMMISE